MNFLNTISKMTSETPSYTAMCDGGPNETDKHPIVFLDLTGGPVRCQYCDKLFELTESEK